MTRGKIFFLLIAVIAYLVWDNLSISAHKTAVLHIPPVARNQDIFVTLWVVEDAQSLWIRAESPRRLWLDPLRESPLVELTRSGQTINFHATPFDDPESQAYVDGMFRQKYGRADQLRGLVMPRDSVPIRLERP